MELRGALDTSRGLGKNPINEERPTKKGEALFFNESCDVASEERSKNDRGRALRAVESGRSHQSLKAMGVDASANEQMFAYKRRDAVSCDRSLYLPRTYACPLVGHMSEHGVITRFGTRACKIRKKSGLHK